MELEGLVNIDGCRIVSHLLEREKILGRNFWAGTFGPELLSRKFYAGTFGQELLGQNFWAVTFGPERFGPELLGRKFLGRRFLGRNFWAGTFSTGTLGRNFWAVTLCRNSRLAELQPPWLVHNTAAGLHENSSLVLRHTTLNESGLSS